MDASAGEVDEMDETTSPVTPTSSSSSPPSTCTPTSTSSAVPPPTAPSLPVDSTSSSTPTPTEHQEEGETSTNTCNSPSEQSEDPSNHNTICPADSSSEPPQEDTISDETSRSTEVVDFKVVYNKRKFDVSFPPDETVGRLKIHLQGVIGIPPAMQKVMVKGLARDERTLRELGVSAGTKLLVVGSTLDDVLAVSSTSSKDLAAEESAQSPAKEPLCQQKQHRKILDRGIPEDAMPGIKNVKESLPAYPLTGMVNKGGGKVRLTFKMEQDQLWIGTKERTDKLPMSSIKNVVSEPISGNEEYHIMGIQLGTTEASRYWVYWVPAQYVDAIKDSILGKWQYF